MEQAQASGAKVLELQQEEGTHGFTTLQVVNLFNATRNAFKALRSRIPGKEDRDYQRMLLSSKTDSAKAMNVFVQKMPNGFNMATCSKTLTKKWDEFYEFQLKKAIEKDKGIIDAETYKRSYGKTKTIGVVGNDTRRLE